jgi:hypothetical protein
MLFIQYQFLVVSEQSILQRYRRHHRKCGLKTGMETAASRVPSLLTFLKDQPQLMLNAESEFHIGTHLVHDVVSNLYTQENKPDDWDTVLSEARQHKPPPALSPNSTATRQIPDETRAGWIMDSYKNFPALRLIYQTYPDSDWFFMIDDDFFLNLDNLELALEQYDPAQP